MLRVQLLLLVALCATVFSLNLPLRGPPRNARKHWVLYQDEDPEPKPTADFLLGTSKSRAALMLDFTSKDTWVAYKNCGTLMCDMETVGYDPTTSTTFRNSTLPFTGSYVTEWADTHTVTGFAVTDLLQHSTYPVNNVTWPSVFGIAQKSDANITLGSWSPDGVVGLAPAASDLFDPVLPHILPKGTLQTLTVWMHEVQDGNAGTEIYEGFVPGSFEFDWYDNCDNTSYFTTPITEGGTWRFASHGVRIGAYSRNTLDQVEIQAQSMLTGVPTSVYNTIVKNTGAKKGSGRLLEVDCKKTYPDFTFVVSGKNLTASSNVYISRDNIIQESQKCKLLLYPVETSGFAPAWKLGYLWFYEMCFHFNLDTLTVGFSHQTWI